MRPLDGALLPQADLIACAIENTRFRAQEKNWQNLNFRAIGASMTDSLPPCPACSSPYTYEADALLACPECGHEWAPGSTDEDAVVIRDSVGNVLADGDTVTVIKDLKVKGSSSSIKVGTKVRGIRLVDGDHDIDCKVPGFGQMGLKSQFVKKVSD